MDQRDPRGLTALMKAAVQGQRDCVTALLLAGEHRSGHSRPSWEGVALLVLWRGCLEQRLGKGEENKVGIYSKFFIDAPWAVRSLSEGTPKMGDGHEFFRQL